MTLAAFIPFVESSNENQKNVNFSRLLLQQFVVWAYAGQRWPMFSENPPRAQLYLELFYKTKGNEVLAPIDRNMLALPKPKGFRWDLESQSNWVLAVIGKDHWRQKSAQYLCEKLQGMHPDQDIQEIHFVVGIQPIPNPEALLNGVRSEVHHPPTKVVACLKSGA
jgi:hypothetical protein